MHRSSVLLCCNGAFAWNLRNRDRVKIPFEPGILILDIGGGNIIISTISCNAVKELGLEVGEDAYAVIKATSVMIGIDD